METISLWKTPSKRGRCSFIAIPRINFLNTKEEKTSSHQTEQNQEDVGQGHLSTQNLQCCLTILFVLVIISSACCWPFLISLFAWFASESTTGWLVSRIWLVVVVGGGTGWKLGLLELIVGVSSWSFRSMSGSWTEVFFQLSVVESISWLSGKSISKDL